MLGGSCACWRCHHTFPVALAAIRSRMDCVMQLLIPIRRRFPGAAAPWWCLGCTWLLVLQLFLLQSWDPGWGRVIALGVLEQSVSEISISLSSVLGWTGLPRAGTCSSTCCLHQALQRVSLECCFGWCWILQLGKIMILSFSVCVHVLYWLWFRAHGVILNFCCFVRPRRNSCP